MGIVELRQELSSRGEAANNARSALRNLNTSLARLEAERLALQRSGGNISALAAQINGLTSTQIPAARTALANAETALRTSLAKLDSELPREALFSSLGVNEPILLLPVRLETRYFRPPTGNAQLLVRVFPDDIHLESHDPDLTQDEVERTLRYRTLFKAAGDSTDDRLRAWQELVAAVGAPRAAYLHTQAKMDERNPPDLQGTRQGWARAPLARSLPDRWAAAGFRGGQRVVSAFGRAIPDPLPVGFTPAGEATATPTDLFDSGNLWMANFDEAERIGMGFRIAFGSREFQALDLLLVYGVRATLDPLTTQTRISDLFANHRYSSGLAFMLPGTPTNNSESASSSYASRDPTGQQSFELATGQSDAPIDTGVVARRVLASLALDTSSNVFERLEHGSTSDEQVVRDVHTAFWPATWEYFVKQMMWPTFVGKQAYIDRSRAFFSGFVRPGGALPTLRVGDQPYGLLPVTAIDAVDEVAMANLGTGGDGENPLSSFLGLNPDLLLFVRRLRDTFFRPATVRVPRAGGPGNPDENVLKILGMDGVSDTVWSRLFMGDHLARNAWQLEKRNGWASYFAALLAGTQPPLRALGYTNWNPRMLGFAAFPWNFRLRGNLVGGSLSETDSSIGFANLANIPWGQLLLGNVFGPTGWPLAYLLARHSLTMAYGMEAMELLEREGFGDEFNGINSHREPELVYRNGFTTETLLSALLRQVRGQQAGEVVKTSPRVTQVVTALRNLGTASSASIERATRGLIDSAAFRLDAWISAYAWRGLLLSRLAKLGAVRGMTAPQGNHLGAFAWVENLSPRTTSRSDGYIVAPSHAQATTAAILRAGFRARSASGTAASMNIDLSSVRVRRAEQILDGVRQGQSLGALLGYRFERGLHESQPALDRYIKNIRDVVPLVANKLTRTTDAVETIAANNVVDGLALVRRYKSDRAGLWAAARLPSMNGTDGMALIRELTALEDALDGVADCLLAESVYQTVRGNPLRGGATLDALSHGEAPPPELEVLQTPRSGTGLTHRVLVAFAPNSPVQRGWPGSPQGGRAQAEPSLNAWLSSLLPDPNTILSDVQFVNRVTSTVVRTASVALSSLALDPIDLLHISTSGAEPWESELGRLLASRVVVPADLAGQDIAVRVTFDLTVGSGISLANVLDLAAAAREVVGRSRGLLPSDFTVPAEDVVGVRDGAALEARMQSALTRLEGPVRTALQSALTGLASARASLATALGLALTAKLLLRVPAGDASVAEMVSAGETALASSANGQPTEQQARTALQNAIQGAAAARLPMETALLQAGRFGLPVAMTQRSNTIDEVEREVRACLDTVQTRAKAARAVTAGDSQPESLVDAAQKRAKAMWGKAFQLVPTQRLSSGELALSVAERATLLAGDNNAPLSWWYRVARVRPNCERLNELFSTVDMLNGRDPRAFGVAQLPRVPGERWVGLDGHTDVPPHRMSFVIQGADALSNPSGFAGLAIDEWTEVIPAEKQPAALTFHFDEPGQRAPQSVLIAVPPTPNMPWSQALLERILLETVDLTKIRAVDSEALGDVGHFLPAMYFAFNFKGETVSTNFLLNQGT